MEPTLQLPQPDFGPGEDSRRTAVWTRLFAQYLGPAYQCLWIAPGTYTLAGADAVVLGSALYGRGLAVLVQALAERLA